MGSSQRSFQKLCSPTRVWGLIARIREVLGVRPPQNRDFLGFCVRWGNRWYVWIEDDELRQNGVGSRGSHTLLFGAISWGSAFQTLDDVSLGTSPPFLPAFVTPVARNAQEILATAVARAEGIRSFYPRHTDRGR